MGGVGTRGLTLFCIIKEQEFLAFTGSWRENFFLFLFCFCLGRGGERKWVLELGSR